MKTMGIGKKLYLVVAALFAMLLLSSLVYKVLFNEVQAAFEIKAGANPPARSPR